MSGWWIVPAFAVGALVARWYLGRAKAVPSHREAIEALIGAVQDAWMQHRKGLDLSAPADLARQMKFIAATFAATVAKTWGTGEVPPPERVWMVTLEAVRRAGTEPPDTYRQAVALLDHTLGG